jgi:uncharacterized membrane protein (DUF2068 family)
MLFSQSALPTAHASASHKGLWFIGLFKLAYAIPLAAASFGVFRLVNEDTGALFEHMILRLHVDPGNRYIVKIAAWVSGIDEHHLRMAGFGAMAYAVLDFIEGVGLLMRKHWAEYLTVIVTGSLLPLEAYEVFSHLTGLRAALLCLNVAIVAYLIRRLWRDAHRRRNLHA